jgi:Dyp-type peroxidase family
MATAAVSDQLELDDLQGLLVRGFGDLKAATFVLLGVSEPAAARGFLGRLAPRLTPASQRAPSEALQVAFTAPGMQRLGLPAAALAGFPLELRGGMATPHRARMLGDEGESAPERWRFGGRTTPAVDVLLLAYARDAPALSALLDPLLQDAAASGLTVLTRLTTSDLGGVEHFGFRDGISQPRLAGLGGAADGDGVVATGELVLGYRNGYGLYADRPLLEAAADPGGLLADDAGGSGRRDLGRNGSYLVLRTLEQDVRGFWRFADAQAGGDPGARVHLAAKLVGRWPSGAPLVQAPDADDPSLAQANAFRYHAEDVDGLRCPIGSHVRRSNPRDSLDPNPGSQHSVDITNLHRLLRRGREYGPRLTVEQALAAPSTGEEERGLHFVCLGSSIARQFEFVHQTWLTSPKFAGLFDQPDPVVSGPGSFSIPALPVRLRLEAVPRFVTVRGGAYLFLPGLRAVRYLAQLR